MFGQATARVLGVFLMVIAVGTMSVTLVGCGGKGGKKGATKNGKKKDTKKATTANKDGASFDVKESVDIAKGTKKAMLPIKMKFGEDFKGEAKVMVSSEVKELKFAPAEFVLKSDDAEKEVTVTFKDGKTAFPKGDHVVNVMAKKGEDEVAKGTITLKVAGE